MSVPYHRGAALPDKVTKDLQNLCARINVTLAAYGTAYPATISNGLDYVSISHALQPYQKNTEDIESNFKLIQQFFLDRVNGCVAIISSQLLGRGLFNITLQRPADAVSIKTALWGSPTDPDLLITLDVHPMARSIQPAEQATARGGFGCFPSWSR